MRIMGIALTSMVVAVGGMLAVGAADTAFAKGPKGCTGKFQKYENGECTTTTSENPDHIPNQSAQFYRSSHHKKKHHAAPAS
jgi:hypothetical protein